MTKPAGLVDIHACRPGSGQRRLAGGDEQRWTGLAPCSRSLAAADGLLVLPADVAELPRGSVVDMIPLR